MKTIHIRILRSFVPLIALLTFLAGTLTSEAAMRKLVMSGTVLDPYAIWDSQPAGRPWHGTFEEIQIGDSFEASVVFDDAVEDTNDVSFFSGGGFGGYPGAVRRMEINMKSPEGNTRFLKVLSFGGSISITDRFTAANVPGAAGQYSTINFLSGGSKTGFYPRGAIIDGAPLFLNGIGSINIFLTHDQRHVFSGDVDGPVGAGPGHPLRRALPPDGFPAADKLGFLIHDPGNTTDDAKGKSYIYITQFAPQSVDGVTPDFTLKQSILDITGVGEVPVDADQSSPCLRIRPLGSMSGVLSGTTVQLEVVLPEPAPAGMPLEVSLRSFPDGLLDHPASITIQPGMQRGLVAVGVKPGTDGRTAVFRASHGGCHALTDIGIGGGEEQFPRIVDLQVFPRIIQGGQNAIGVLTFDHPFPGGAIEAEIQVISPDGTDDANIYAVLQEGASGAFFNISTSPVSSESVYKISASFREDILEADLTVMPQTAERLLDRLALTPESVTGTDGSTGTIILTRPAPAGGLTVQLTSNDIAAAVPSAVFIPENQIQTQFSIHTVQVDSVNAVTLTATHGPESVSATLGVFPGPADPVLSSLVVNPRILTDGQSAIGEVRFNRTLFSPIQVRLHTFSRDLIIPPMVTVQSGTDRAFFMVNSLLVSREIRALVTASAGGVEKTAIVDLNPSLLPRLAGIQLESSIVPQSSALNARLLIDRPAPEGGLTVALTAWPSAIVSVPATVTIPAGSHSVDFTIPAGDDPSGNTYQGRIVATSHAKSVEKAFLATGADMDTLGLYEHFASRTFGADASDPGVSGPDVIPPGSSIPNFLRYAFGPEASPADPTYSRPRLSVDSNGRPAISFRFAWPSKAADLSLRVQQSESDPQSGWFDLPPDQFSFNITGIQNDGLYLEAEAVISLPEQVNDVFFRLVAGLIHP